MFVAENVKLGSDRCYGANRWSTCDKKRVLARKNPRDPARGVIIRYFGRVFQCRQRETLNGSRLSAICFAAPRSCPVFLPGNSGCLANARADQKLGLSKST
jgi:hypothetical protein